VASPIPSGFKDKYGKRYYNGLPYTGKVYDIKEKDPEDKKPVEIMTVYVKQFISTDDAQMKEWQEILQRVADGVSTISFEEKVYDEKLGAWRILIRWMDLAYTNPEGV
jgi:hypothetical protein